MSAKTGLEGIYRWIPVAQELPEDCETVLICNLDAWDDPVQTGYCDDGEWFWSHLPTVPLDGLDCFGGHDCQTQPPTHWMRFPKPPGVAIIPNLSNIPIKDVPGPDNPFTTRDGSSMHCVAYDRIHAVKRFTAAECLQALRLHGVAKTVRVAIYSRLRKLERGAAK